MKSRIGIFTGAFDPVHDGHISFGLEAIKQAQLDRVYFIVEAKPRFKPDISHFAHRQAMLKIATNLQKSLAVLELPDRQFSVAKTLPRLNQKFKDDELFLLVGSDVIDHLGTWPMADKLLERMNLIVGRRSKTQTKAIEAKVNQLPIKPQQLIIIDSPDANLSSREIRQTLLAGHRAKGLSPAVQAYIKANWLYASPSNSSSAS